MRDVNNWKSQPLMKWNRNKIYEESLEVLVSCCILVLLWLVLVLSPFISEMESFLDHLTCIHACMHVCM